MYLLDNAPKFAGGAQFDAVVFAAPSTRGEDEFLVFDVSVGEEPYLTVRSPDSYIHNQDVAGVEPREYLSRVRQPPADSRIGDLTVTHDCYVHAVDVV